MGLERIHPEDQGVKDAGVCMYMKRLDQEREQHGNFGMDQIKEAQADEKQQKALHEFKPRNEGHAVLV